VGLNAFRLTDRANSSQVLGDLHLNVARSTVGLQIMREIVGSRGSGCVTVDTYLPTFRRTLLEGRF
jgi:hypothetical protein